MTLKNGFGKCSSFVLSASGWKDQNMASPFSRQRKPEYGEGIVWLANRVAVWRQSEISIDFSACLLFLFCSSVFILKSYENRSYFSLCCENIFKEYIYLKVSVPLKKYCDGRDDY